MVLTPALLFISAVLVSTGANIYINRSPGMRNALESLSQRLENMCGNLDRVGRNWETKLEGVERKLDEQFEGTRNRQTTSSGDDLESRRRLLGDAGGENDGGQRKTAAAAAAAASSSQGYLGSLEKKLEQVVEGLENIEGRLCGRFDKSDTSKGTDQKVGGNDGKQ